MKCGRGELTFARLIASEPCHCPRRPWRLGSSPALISIALCVLSVFTSLAYARKPKPARCPPQMAAPKSARPDPRHIRPSDWKRGTQLFLDPVYGAFTRGALNHLVKSYELYAVYVDWNKDLVVQVPEPNDWRGFTVAKSYPMDEVWLENEAGTWKIHGKRSGVEYVIENGEAKKR